MQSILRFTQITVCGLLVVLPVQGRAAPQAAGSDAPSQQVVHGVALYKQRCGACHNTPSRSLDEAPLLAGPAFAQKWLARRAALFQKIRYSMPQDNPGTLSDEEAQALVAALASGYISGKAPAK
ncbi:hypothetical protein HK27_14135 [Acetobacter orientalis]|uniref:c-type cytochrome n=1 Tax=Acetobacter orientalis TaxID=146474 RepID=UPI000A3CCEC2|nr:cytochrome c [Acetobacter orientalis]OUJ17372.1 hypothetical protein HK27_14135 [Acetobacter orientalis]